MSHKQPKIITQEARYSVHLGYVILPIDFRDLRNSLTKNGYELASVTEIPPLPSRVRFGGEIARKGEIRVAVDSDSGEIVVIGRSLSDVFSSFEGLATLISSELEVNLHENVRFYQVVVHYKFATGSLPYNEIPKTENKSYVERFGKILGEPVSMFSLRLAPKEATPNQDNWFDIAIEPDIINKKLYHVGVVFRNPSREKTEAFVKSLEDNLTKLIGEIEA